MKKTHLKRAVELCPQNQLAPTQLTFHYLVTAQLDLAYKSLSTCSNIETWQSLAYNVITFLASICSIPGLSLDNSAGRFYNDVKIHELLEQIIVAMPDQIEKKHELKFRYAILLMRWSENGNLLKAFEILSDLKKKWIGHEKEILVELAELSSSSYLNYPNEQEGFACQALATFDKANDNTGGKIDKMLVNERYILETNLASAYVANGNYKLAIEILERHLLFSPNNTDVYTYAKALLKMQRYSESLEYCKIAVLRDEDASTLSLLAENYYYMQNYDMAAKTYRETLAFLDRDGKFTVRKYTDSGDQITIHWQTKKWHEKWCREVYERLVHSYCSVGDFVSAMFFRDMALSQYSDLQSLQIWGPVIDKIVDSMNVNEALKAEVLRVGNEYQMEKKRAEEITNKVRHWTRNLTKIQTVQLSSSIDLDNEENWENFAQAVDSIIENMKNENGNNSQQYDEILRQTQKKYPRLERTSTDFLATAEYLYSVHKGIRMDFAPIMVEYCKVVEYELKRILEIFNANRMELRFFDMIEIVRRNNINKLGDIADKLHKIRHLRNGSAHSGVSTEKRVSQVRQLLFDDDIINKLCSGKA